MPPRTIKSVCKKSFHKVLFSMPLRKIILSLSKVYFGVVGGNKKKWVRPNKMAVASVPDNREIKE
jgi:hypothetical protein